MGNPKVITLQPKNLFAYILVLLFTLLNKEFLNWVQQVQSMMEEEAKKNRGPRSSLRGLKGSNSIGSMVTRTHENVSPLFFHKAASQHMLICTTLRSMMNAKLSPHRFWPCHENGLIKMIQMIPHNLYVRFKLTCIYCGLRIIMVCPNQ